MPKPTCSSTPCHRLFRGLLPACLTIWLAAALGHPAPTAAQEVPSGAPAGAGETTATSDPGPRLGPFRLQSQIELSALYDSNIFSLRRDPVDDTLLVLAPSVAAATDWERHRLGWSAGALLGRYNENPAEDYDDYWVRGDGRYDLSAQANLFAGLGYAFQHEDRGSPSELVAGDQPTTYTSLTAHAGVSHDLGPARLRVGGTFEQLDFDDNGLRVGDISFNDLRDREQTGLGVRVTWPLNDRVDAYGQAIHDRRSYDLAASSGRDSSGYQAGGGLLARLSNRLQVEFYLGLIDQEYDDPLFDRVNTIDFGGELNWLPSRATRVKLTLDRTLEESTLAGSSSYLYSSFGANVSHRLQPGVTVHGELGLARAAYQDVDRDDDYYTAEAGLRYDLSRRWYLAASYRISLRDSSERSEVDNSANLQKLEDFDRELVWLTLGAHLGAGEAWAQDDRLGSLFIRAASNPWAGPYAGLTLGHDLLGYQTVGQRSGGTDTGPYADAGLGLGGFAGYGFTAGRWFLGLEAEVTESNASFAHAKDKANSRSYRGEGERSYALSLRPGLVTYGGNLLYVRFGYVESEFDLSAARNDEPANAFRGQVESDGWRYGLGADVPVDERLYLRLDFSHSDYEAFDLDLVSESENWEPRRDLFQLGLGWRFGGAEPPPAAALPPPESGPYVGAVLVHSTLLTAAEGVHADSNPPPGGSFDFSGDFGRSEFSGGGAFLGYGWTHGRWGLALEGEIDAGEASWHHVRTEGGRNFSVTREGSRELALRLGYHLPGGAQIYLRAGRVWTRFNTTWTKGNNRANDVARDDDVTGVRFGVGAEIGLSERLFTRLEYGYTQYESYGFTTEHGQPDEMDFDNSEGVFRIGFGVRM